MAFHAFTAAANTTPSGHQGNFLKFWKSLDQQESPDNDDEIVISDSCIDILKGIIDLRDQVAYGGKDSLPLNQVVLVLQEIRDSSVFPESAEYWDSVIAGLSGDDNHDDMVISLDDISEAVLVFLKNLSSPQTDPSSSSSSHADELENFKQYINTTLEKLREEVGIETGKLRIELDHLSHQQQQDKDKPRVDAPSQSSTRFSTPRENPVAPPLPFPPQSATTNNNGMFRFCCSNGDIGTNCLIQ